MTINYLLWLGVTIEALAVILAVVVVMYRVGPAQGRALRAGPLREVLLTAAAGLAILFFEAITGPKPLYTHLLFLAAVAVLIVRIARSRPVLPA